MNSVHAPTPLSIEQSSTFISIEDRDRGAIDSLSLKPREDGKIVTGYRTTAFGSLYGPNGGENILWADYFEKIDAVCG